MIDQTLALLLPHSQTVIGAALLATTLAALMLMDYRVEGPTARRGDDR